MPRSPLRNADFRAWAKERATPPRADKLEAANIENIAEEIDSIGRSEKREIVSRLSVLAGAFAEMAVSAGAARQ